MKFLGVDPALTFIFRGVDISVILADNYIEVVRMRIALARKPLRNANAPMRINMENRNDQSEAPWWQPGLVLFMKLSGWIAGPVIIGIFVGKWLDRKYNSGPWLFLLSVGIAFFLSMFGIIRDAMREMKRIEREENKKKEEKSKK